MTSATCVAFFSTILHDTISVIITSFSFLLLIIKWMFEVEYS